MAKSQWFGRQRQKEIEELLRGKMKLATEFVLSEAKRRCPVDTGNLRDSLNQNVVEEAGEIIGRIGTNVSYAGYVEYGDERGMKPRGTGTIPFLRPALLENKRQITEFLT